MSKGCGSVWVENKKAVDRLQGKYSFLVHSQNMTVYPPPQLDDPRLWGLRP